MLNVYPDLILRVGVKEGTGSSSGALPALIPGWVERVATCEALLWVRLPTWVVMAATADVKSPQGLLHFLHCGSFILTREFLCWLDLGGWLWSAPILVPPPPHHPFLGVEGGADVLLLGGILEIRTETK